MKKLILPLLIVGCLLTSCKKDECDKPKVTTTDTFISVVTTEYINSHKFTTWDFTKDPATWTFRSDEGKLIRMPAPSDLLYHYSDKGIEVPTSVILAYYKYSI